MAREQLLGNYRRVIGAELCYSLICSLVGMCLSVVAAPTGPYELLIRLAVNVIVSLLIMVLYLGLCYFYMRLVSGAAPGYRDLFYGFSGYADKTIIVTILVMVRVFLWNLVPIIIAGVIAAPTLKSFTMDAAGVTGLMSSPAGMGAVLALTLIGFILTLSVFLSFSQVFYIILDFPELAPGEVLKKSKELMRGKRLRYLGLLLSFIPFLILGIMSMGIAFIIILPYIRTTLVNFYLDVASA